LSVFVIAEKYGICQNFRSGLVLHLTDNLKVRSAISKIDTSPDSVIETFHFTICVHANES